MSMENNARKYYTAYEERYKTAHAQGISWSSDVSTPIVSDVLKRYGVSRKQKLLEIGCGEGRDARAVLEQGYDLLATDISPEAIRFCREKMPGYADHFCVLDCLSEKPERQYDFIYAVAVIHMLVLDSDRNGFYRFVRDSLKEDGLALICTMGDGKYEMQSDISRAFEVQERQHESGTILVAGTSCRMVSFPTFERELEENGLYIMEKGITPSFPDFDKLMYAVVKRHGG